MDATTRERSIGQNLTIDRIFNLEQYRQISIEVLMR